MTRLKELRKAKGLKQKELAEKAGVSLKALQAYEQNFRPLGRASAQDVYHLAKALDTTIEDLLELERLKNN
jgi:transcriptional regulator with XRE-family HTH domain